MKLLSYLAFVACLEGLAFGIIVLWLRPKEVLNRLGLAIGLLNAWWNFCDRLSYVAVLGLNPVIAWFFLRFAEVSNRVILWLLVPVCATLGLVGYEYLTSGFPETTFQPGPWGNVLVPATGHTWSTVSAVTAIGLDLVYFGILVRRAVTARSWRLKRLIRVVLAGIGLAIAFFLVLGLVTQAFGVPQLIFLPGAFFLVLSFYVIVQYRFLRISVPTLERHLAEALTEPALLLDKDAKVIGANQSARKRLFPPQQDPAGQDFALLLEDPLPFRTRWAAAKNRDARVGTLPTAQGLLRLSPHYDRFGDFVGAVALFSAPHEQSSERETLSDREAEVLDLIVAGNGNQAIADRLFISRDTVKTHVHNILAKTGTRTRQDLLRFGGLRR